MNNKPHLKVQVIQTETQALRFLGTWREFLSSDKADVSAVLQKLGELGKFYGLNVYPFYLACIRHNSPVIRLGGLDAIESLAAKAFHKKYVNRLRSVLQRDQDPTVRGAAARALGYLAGIYRIPRILELLLSLVTDNNRTSSERLGAYQGLLYLTGKLLEPGFEPWKIELDEPVARQIDWKWVDELKSNGRQEYQRRSIVVHIDAKKMRKTPKAALKRRSEKKRMNTNQKK